MDTIKIKKNTCGDTRTAKGVPTIRQFERSNRMHCTDVSEMMKSLAAEIGHAGNLHDITKMREPDKSLFYRELCSTIEGKMNFVEGRWYPMHCQTERHHIDKFCHDDVNLIDILEMICDCVCAGMARSGKVRPIEIPSEVLQKAVVNTVEMCRSSVELVDDEEVSE